MRDAGKSFHAGTRRSFNPNTVQFSEWGWFFDLPASVAGRVWLVGSGLLAVGGQTYCADGRLQTCPTLKIEGHRVHDSATNAVYRTRRFTTLQHIPSHHATVRRDAPANREGGTFGGRFLGGCDRRECRSESFGCWHGRAFPGGLEYQLLRQAGAWRNCVEVCED